MLGALIGLVTGRVHAYLSLIVAALVALALAGVAGLWMHAKTLRTELDEQHVKYGQLEQTVEYQNTQLNKLALDTKASVEAVAAAASAAQVVHVATNKAVAAVLAETPPAAPSDAVQKAIADAQALAEDQ